MSGEVVPPAPEAAVSPAPVAAAPPAPEAAAPRPDHLCVVSDSAGYVGTFSSLEAASAAVLKKHPFTPFLVQKFPVAPGPVDTVWVVLYRDLDAVAFVSNDRAEALRVQGIFANVGLTYVDSIDYWEQPIGTIAKAASDRLDSQTRAQLMYIGDDEESFRKMEEEDHARLEALTAPRKDGPLARLILENERITIFDAVVPTAFGEAHAAGPESGVAARSETPGGEAADEHPVGGQ